MCKVLSQIIFAKYISVHPLILNMWWQAMGTRPFLVNGYSFSDLVGHLSHTPHNARCRFSGRVSYPWLSPLRSTGHWILVSPVRWPVGTSQTWTTSFCLGFSPCEFWRDVLAWLASHGASRLLANPRWWASSFAGTQFSIEGATPSPLQVTLIVTNQFMSLEKLETI